MEAELAQVRQSIATVLNDTCPSPAVHAFIDGRDALDVRLLQLATELGWLAIALPEAHGGIGLGAAGLAVLHFELGRAAAPGPFLSTSVALAILARSDAADEAPIAKLIADALAGITTLAIAAKPEPLRGDGPVWLLGEQNAAAALLVGDGDDLMLIDVAGAGPERVAIWDETRSMISLSRSKARLLATLPGARPVFEALFAITVAADSAGGACGTLDRTILYMKERQQFGRPIGSFQALKHRAADHLVHSIAADRLVWQAVDYFDTAGPGASLWPAMAKANVTEMAVKIAGDCVQLHGGVGYTREYHPHLYLKRARLNEMLLASNAVLRDRAERAFGDAVRGGHDVLEVEW